MMTALHWLVLSSLLLLPLSPCPSNAAERLGVMGEMELKRIEDTGVKYKTPSEGGSHMDNEQTTKTSTVSPHSGSGSEVLLAEMLCTMLASTIRLQGTFYAVERNCMASANATNCWDICESQALRRQDPSTAQSSWKCYGAYHIYHVNPSVATDNPAVPRLGHRISVEKCSSAHCGPNFCCCRAY